MSLKSFQNTYCSKLKEFNQTQVKNEAVELRGLNKEMGNFILYAAILAFEKRFEKSMKILMK